MNDKVSRLAPTGKMDRDSDPRYVGKGDSAGDYRDARNVQRVTPEEGDMGSVEPTLGNEFAFDLGSVSQQNKRYRITFDGDATKQHEARFLSTQRDANMVVGTGPNQALQFNGTVLDFLSAFNAAISGSGVLWSIQVNPSTPNVVELELASYPMYQWYLDSVGPDVADVVCVAEAIPVDLAGPLKDIGSYDLLGDLFIFSTTQGSEPTQIIPAVSSVGPTSGGTYIGPLTSILFNGEHGLIQGQWIRITGSAEPFLNGVFVIHSIIDPQTIRIVTSTAWGIQPAVSPGGIGSPKVFIHPTGIGEIGVAQKNDDSGTWSYTRLLRSVELNFVCTHGVDSFARRRVKRVSIYSTDNYNIPMSFDYAGDYEEDGLLNFINSTNSAVYDEIYEYAAMQIPEPPTTITLDRQIRGTGQLLPGFKLYFVRQVTETGQFSPYSSPSQPILVMGTRTVNDERYGYTDFAGYTDDPTDKANVILIDGFLDATSYPDAEIYVLEYVGDSLVFNKIASFRTPVSGRHLYEHTGRESAVPVDIGEVISSQSFSKILKAKNIREIDLRNVVSNGTEITDIDLSAFTTSFRHRIVKKTLDEYTVKKVSEYQVPENNISLVGLTMNETYRVGCRAYIKNLGWSSWHWVDDIKIDSSSVNESNPADDRRISGMPSYNLAEVKAANVTDIPFQALENNARNLNEPYTDISGNSQTGYVGTKGDEWSLFFQNKTQIHDQYYNYLVPQLEFEPDWSVSIEDIGNASASEIITHIEFGIGDVPKSVKSSGYGVLGVKKNQFSPFGTTLPAPFSNALRLPGSVFEFPFNPVIPGAVNTTSTYNIPNYPFTHDEVGNFVELEQRSDFLSYYSADCFLSENDGETFNGTSILVLGSMQSSDIVIGPQFFGASIKPWAHYSHLHPFGPEYNSQPVAFAIEEAAISDDKDIVFFQNGDTFERVDQGFRYLGEAYSLVIAPSPPNVHNERLANPVFRLGASIPSYPEPFVTKQFRGVLYCQVYKDERPNFVPINETQYLPVGSIIETPRLKPVSVSVRGGDTYTSVFYFKHRPRFYDNNVVQNTEKIKLQGSLVGFVSQTRNNPRLLKSFGGDENSRFKTWPNDYYVYNNSLSSSVAQASSISSEMYLIWSTPTGGSGVNPTTSEPFLNDRYEVSDPNEMQSLKSLFYYPTNYYFGLSFGEASRPTRVWWSEKAFFSELTDSYRVFLLINHKDLDPSFGEIFHHENVNGELFTLQPRKWQRQLFNTRGELQVSGNAIGAVIGDGSVLARDGQTLSAYGTQNKWSCMLGKSDGGKDTLYWYNAENGLFMRFGADGTVVISERARFRSFANRAAKWLRGKDTPAFEQGIRAVWDDRSKEVIWTFTGWRTVTPWQNSGQFLVQSTVGTVVSNPNAPSDTYESLPRFFRCTVAHANSSSREPGVGADWQNFWEQIAYDDFEYYSVFTVAYNEMVNGFSTFYGHIPKTYLKWRDTFLSSHPTIRNLLFEHRKGLPGTWYGKAGVCEPKIEDAHIEMIMNDLPEQSKRYTAVEVLAEETPGLIEFRTKNQYTWADQANFKVNDDQYRAPIGRDATATNDPQGDSRRMDGDYLRVKFVFPGQVMNRLHSIVVKFRDRLRTFRR